MPRSCEGTPNASLRVDARGHVAAGSSETAGGHVDVADPRALAAIAAYLGEAPCASAMRCPNPVGQGLPAVQSARRHPARSSSARRRRRDLSPPDTPESRAGSHRFDASAFDEDRPPTPTPGEFESFPSSTSELTARPRVASREPQAQLQQTQLPDAQESQSSVGKRPPMPRKQSHARSGSLGTAGAMLAGGDGAEPRPGRATEMAPQMGRKVMVEDDEKMAPVGGVIFLDGVGWCDEYGRPVGAAKGLPDLTALVPNGRTRTKLMPAGVDTAATKANRFSSAGRKPRRALSESRALESKVSCRNKDLNWATLGGI